MDPKVIKTQVNENDEHQPLNAQEVQFSDNDNSVMGKVKARAKKFKDAFKTHGHQVLDHVHGTDNNNQDQNSPDHHHNLDQDEEVTETQGIDGLHVEPTSEQVVHLGNSGINAGDLAVTREEPPHKPRVDDVFPTTETDQNIVTDSAKTSVGKEKREQYKDNLEKDPHKPGSGHGASFSLNSPTRVTDPRESGVGETDIKPILSEESSQTRFGGVSPTTEIGEEKVEQYEDDIESEFALKEKTRLPESKPEAYTPHNFQTKATDLTGAGVDEIGMKPVEESFARMKVQDEPKSDQYETQYPSTESHDKYVPDLSKTLDPHAGDYEPSSEHTVNSTSTKVEGQPFQESVEKQAKQNNTDEISSTFSENAVSSEPYGVKEDTQNKVKPHEEPKTEGASNKTGTAASLTEKLAPVYDKVSKVSGTRNEANTGTETENEVNEPAKIKGASVKEYVAEKLKPGEEDKALSEIISGALKRKEEPKKSSGDEDSIAALKRKEEPKKSSGDEDSIVSKEVADSKVDEETNVNTSSPREGVVGKLKGVVGSWFSKAGENQSSQVAGGEDLPKKNDKGEVEQVVTQAEGEKKL